VRAWQVTGHGEPRDVLARTDIDPPAPAADEVRVRVLAAAVSLPDVMMCRGAYAYAPTIPFTPGQEVTGEVTAAGSAASFAIGDRVMGVTRFDAGAGGFADEALVRSASAYRVPAGLSDVDAAGFYIAYATGWYGLVSRGELAPGEWMAVLGAAGGTGAAAVQLGHALGAHVIAVVGDDDGDDHKARYCRSLGAEHVVDHRRESVPDALRDLSGDGVAVIYDPVGGAPAIDALGGLATGGRLLAIGFASGPGEQPSSRHVLRRNASIMGVFVGAYDRATNEETVARLGQLAADGRIGGLATATVGFDDVPDALERVARRHVTGRIVVVP
jgi:NADPH2:quinone reductase